MQLKLSANPLKELSSSFLLPRALGLLKKQPKLVSCPKERWRKKGAIVIYHLNRSISTIFVPNKDLSTDLADNSNRS